MNPQNTPGIDPAIVGHGLQALRQHPAWRVAKGIALALALGASLLGPLWLKNYGLIVMCLWCVYTITAQGLNLTLGYAGQVSLAQAGFMGLGAYTSTLLVKQLEVNFWLALIMAGLTSTCIGALIGFPALRVRAHYLSFVTLGFNTLLFLVLRNEEWLTGGNFGIKPINRPSLLGLSLDTNTAYYYFCLSMLALVTLALWHMLRSPWGRAFKTLRDNPARADSLGISITAHTLLAFAIGSGIAGISGAVYAPLIEYIEPAPFALSRSLLFLLMVIVGGRGTLLGPFIGAALVTLLPEWLRYTEDWYLVLFSIAVMALMLFFPQGIAGVLDVLNRRFSRRIEEKT